MKVKWLWLGLFVISTLVALYFNAILSYRLYYFFKLSSSSLAQIESWGVKKLSPSRFALTADFTFTVGGKPYKGTTVFSQPIFPNEDAAGGAVKEKSPTQEKVYYSPSSPKISSLQNDFPLKALFRGVLPLIIIIYFFALKSRFREEMIEEK